MNEPIRHDLNIEAAQQAALAEQVRAQPGLERIEIVRFAGEGAYAHAYHLRDSTVLRLSWMAGAPSAEMIATRLKADEKKRDILAYSNNLMIPGFETPRLIDSGVFANPVMVDGAGCYVSWTQVTRISGEEGFAPILTSEARNPASPVPANIAAAVAAFHQAGKDACARAPAAFLASPSMGEELWTSYRVATAEHVYVPDSDKRLGKMLKDVIEDEILIKGPENSVICSGDLHSKNIFFDQRPSGYGPTGFIDLDQMYRGFPETDLAPLSGVRGLMPAVARHYAAQTGYKLDPVMMHAAAALYGMGGVLGQGRDNPDIARRSARAVQDNLDAMAQHFPAAYGVHAEGWRRRCALLTHG